MYQALLLSDSDVVALRAALNDPRFSSLAALVPGLCLALQHPQPELDRNLMGWVYDALREVRANTNYPEDWDYLSETMDEAWESRLGFEKAKEQAAEAGTPAQTGSPAEVAQPAPALEYFCIVHESVGSGDPFEFGEVIYDDFSQAVDALAAYVYEHLQRPSFDGYVVASHAEVNANPGKYADLEVLIASRDDVEKTAYMLHTYGGISVRYSFFLQKFTKAAPDGGAA